MLKKAENAKSKKAFKMPHTFVILLIIILVAVALTWVIPSGEYARYENASGTKVVDASQFTYVDDVSVSLTSVPLMIVNAFIKNADLIMLVLFSGGAIYMLTSASAGRQGGAAVQPPGRNFHSDADACFGPDLHNSGCQHLYRLCAHYGYAIP